MRNKRVCLTALALLLTHDGKAAFDSAQFDQSDKPLEIARITPDGEDVPPGRQLVIQFNQPVVPVGRMERDAAEIPIDVTPRLACEWRWLNTSALACQLGERAATRLATRYRIVVSSGIETEDGRTLGEAVTHEFITERPKVEDLWFETWRGPGTPQINVIFNQLVTRASVERHVFLRRAGEAPRRRAVTATQTDQGQPGPQRAWRLEPQAALPLASTMELAVEPGLVSADGPEAGQEDRVVVAFSTFPEFRFLGVRCTDNAHNELRISLENNDLTRKCNPLAGTGLAFSAPVIGEVIRDHVIFGPDLAGDREDYDPWANYYSYSTLSSPHQAGQEYVVWLPENLRAARTYNIASGVELKDEFGRRLPEPIEMVFATDHRLPDFVLNHPLSVLERRVATEVPIVVTNLDSLTIDYGSLTATGAHTSLTTTFSLPAAQDIAYRTPLGVRDMLGGVSGVVIGTVFSQSKGGSEPLFAQITPYQVNVKAGHYNTLVWVTDFSTGKPVPDARVEIIKSTFDGLTGDAPVLGRSATDLDGAAMLAGLNELSPRLELINAYDWKAMRLFVRVVKNDNIALLPLDYDFRVETYRASNYTIYSSLRRKYGHIHTWGTTAQGVYRAGDTIQYKFYARDQDGATFVPAPREGYTLRIVDPTDKTAHEITDLTLSEFGAFHGEFTVPETAPVGWYRFALSAQYTDQTWEPMRVLVSDFVPAAFRVTTDVDGKLFQPGQRLTIGTQASLHAGGPYADAAARVTATLRARPLELTHALARGFRFDVYHYDQPDTETLFQTESEVSDQGSLETGFAVPDSPILHGRITVESAVQDDRGKFIAGFADAEYRGRDRFVGLRTTSWVFKEDEPASVDVLVIDENGEPVADTEIQIAIERLETLAARVKGAGNAYLTQYSHNWVEAASCELTSATEPLACEFVPADPGDYRLIAHITDSQGRAHATELRSWVIGKGRVLWEEPADNSLTVIPEQEDYQVGDTARYLVKNPFPGAKALVTVERYGVLKHWVETFKSSTPVVEFEVEESFLPGFYLSVTVTSPRVEQPLGDDGVDLGKPAMRMGYVETGVRDSYKEIAVEIDPAQEVYKPGDTVQVNLQASPRHAGKTEPIELAVAVLDEAVFDLIAQGRAYFDPYGGFYTIEELDLENFSLMMRLVGRQKFEKKGANAGGDGGAALDFRSVFKYVSYWNPSIEVEAGQPTQIDFEAPDNLTGWRVLAMAVTPSDRMGLGEGTFKVNRDTELRPVMPNQVIEGDRFHAGFSVMNRTDTAREITVSLSAQGAVETSADASAQQTVSVAPYKRMLVWLPVTAANPGEIRFTATAGDEQDRDALAHVVPVHRRQAVQTSATYGTTTADAVTETIAFPGDIRTDVGEAGVVVSPSVIGNVQGAFEYMEAYPYTCWEQKLTRGTMASHYLDLKDYVPDTFSWPGSDTLPQDMLDQAANYQAPNGGMAYYTPSDQYVSPYLSAYTALAFNWSRTAGHTVPSDVEQRLHDYLSRLLRRDVVPDFYSKGMASTVRAAALAGFAPHGKIVLEDIKRYRPHVADMSLFGKALYLQAALAVPGSEDIRAEVAKLILSHANQSGGKFVFNEALDTQYQRILASPVRSNCAVLSAFSAYGETDAGAQLVGDVPFKLVRTITQTRGNRDHWENTQENMFCMNALIEYSRVYESEAPDMQVVASLSDEPLGQTSFDDLRDNAQTLSRPLREGDPGQRANLHIERTGSGRLYYSARLAYSPREPRAEPTNAGIEIRREYSVERDDQWQLLSAPMQLERGELVRVDLYASLPTARNFVVIDDPVPGGLEPVNRDLATASVVDADKGAFKPAGGSWWYRFSDWYGFAATRWSFYHQELRHDAARFYSDYLPPGNYHLSYTAQVIAPGEFEVLPAKAEEMYDPDVFGLTGSSRLEVGFE